MTVFDNNGTIAISFEHRKKRFVLSGLGDFSDTKQLQQVQQTELRIKSDRKSNNFPFADNESVKLFYFPSSEDRQQMIARTIATERKADKLNPSLLSIWDKWVTTLGLSQATLNNHYHCCRQMILSSGNPKAHDVKWFDSLRDGLSGRTFNERKSMLKACLDWSVNNDLVSGKNPYESVKTKKSERNDHAKPFSRDEIAAIIEAFQSDRFVHKSSHFSHSHYVPFIKFQFVTGCRLGEAIALQWKHMDFANRRILIEQALGRDLASSPNASKKILKSTKTGAIGFVPMNDLLYDLLLTHKPIDASPTDWVFKGHRGDYISTASFRDTWNLVLSNLDIEYRYPYQMKHTALSFVATQQGLLAASKLARHTDVTMAARHYARFVDEVKLPDYGI